MNTVLFQTCQPETGHIPDLNRKKQWSRTRCCNLFLVRYVFQRMFQFVLDILLQSVKYFLDHVKL